MKSSPQLRLPKHWPSHVTFVSSLSYHSSVDPAVLTFLRPKQSSYEPPVEWGCHHIIRSICEISHPAYGQSGLFAAKKIPAKSYILDYLGEVHCDDRPLSDYDVSLYRFQDGISVGIDASVMGNEARFINDYRGIKARPNAGFRERRAECGELRMCIWSLQNIQKGEEIVVSYGKSWWNARISIAS